MTLFNKFSYYKRHEEQKKILQTVIFDVLPNFPFTASETIRDY